MVMNTMIIFPIHTMGNSLAKTILFLVLMLASHLPNSEARICVFTDDYTIYVANKLPPNSDPLQIHCASKNNDLGFHNLTTNQEFNWSFCTRVFGRTLFFCHFWWGKKDVQFDVFKDSWAKRCSGDQCYWAAKSD
ncbi:S-protein homolog 2-like, partial [Primulina huaijiensis]|uniref:S-protein homolog 2-like n=1 Tax=Primulina huaijiensis TaxID=1492673 RepID=UPI003CC731F1